MPESFCRLSSAYLSHLTTEASVMAEIFNRRDEICSWPLDEQGINQLSSMLREEFLNRPQNQRKEGTNNVVKNDGDLTLSTFYKHDGNIGLFGMSGIVSCDEKKYVVVSFDDQAKLTDIAVAENGQWVMEMEVDRKQAK
jgi:hypothetical protein